MCDNLTPGVPGPSRKAWGRRLCGVCLLFVGLGLSAWIWQRAGAGAETSGYVVIDGVAYPQRLEDTKAYNRRMEAFGGKGLVLAEKLEEWFSGLGRSRGVAGGVAVFVLGLGGWLLLSRPARPDDDDSDDGAG
ncbi:hypothetical protein [Solidesulfovibrio sp. C21]|uniref:hypothetical protein n=1 Tax=Solidesulfovibrio sp. C21 TaxID=3398613 RepID=UPI0039FB993C